MNTFIRWGKFSLVGAMGVAVQIGALALFNHGAPGHYLYASAAALELTLLHNFLWHRQYTWRDRRGSAAGAGHFVRFHLSNGLISMVGNLALMRLLVDEARLPLLVSNGIAILCCSSANFFVGNNWAFAGAGNAQHRNKPCLHPRMSFMWLFLLMPLLLFPQSANSEIRRWEVGAQLVRLDLDSIGEAPGGAGGRISYAVNPFVAIEAEANRYFEDASHNFGHTELLVGGRYGYWFGPLGIFAKTRPGLVRLGGGTGARNPGRENHFALDVGGVIMIGRGRAGLRIDAGDTIVFWGSQPFAVGVPLPVTKNNRQLSIGFVFRF